MMVTDAGSEYFAWRHYHPRQAEDPRAVWGAAWLAGGRAALRDSARVVELVPLLAQLLVLLEDGRIEALGRSMDRRPLPAAWLDDDEDECRVSW